MLDGNTSTGTGTVPCTQQNTGGRSRFLHFSDKNVSKFKNITVYKYRKLFSTKSV